MTPTHEILLDRWQHATQGRRNYSLKTWKGVLSFWAKWLRKLLDSPVKGRLPDDLRPAVEAELKWCLADLAYLTTLSYSAPTDAGLPPSLARNQAEGTSHPFIHILLERRCKKARVKKVAA